MYTGFASIPKFTGNLSVLTKAVNITSSLLGYKLTLKKAVIITGKKLPIFFSVKG